MRRISRIGLLLASFLIAFAVLAIGRAALSAPDADVDLAITKNASIDPVIAGNPLTYTLSITNLGPLLATGVTITDTLPGGVTFTSASAGCRYDNPTGRVICSLGDMDVGVEITRTVEVLVNSSAPGTLENRAQVGSGDTDTNTANNLAVLTTNVTTSADLVLSVLESSDPLIAGGLITYTASITNSGPSDASNVIFLNENQSGLSFVTAPVLCNHHGRFLDCALGVIPANNRVDVLFTFSTGPDRTQGLTNTATVSTDTIDPNLANNRDTDETSLISSSDVAITKTTSAGQVLPGGVLSYTLTITNNGLSNAQAVSVSDTLPPQVLYQSYTSSKGSCSGTLTITCIPGFMSPAEVVTIVLWGMADPLAVTGTITNTATVATTTSDPIPGNNSALAEVTITEEYADLQVTKSDSADPLLAGELLTYTIGITNTGPADASNVVVADTLPSGLTLVSTTPSQGTCTGAVCDLGGIPVTHTATITLVADVGTALGGVISNTVIVSANEIDLVPGDNTAIEQTTILPLADLSLQKTGSPDPVHAGELLTYRLNVTNLGPSAAADVHLVDDLPAEVAFISVQPACDYSAGIVDCTLGSLAPSATVPVTITVQVSAATGIITNTATVTTTTSDSFPGNNSASAEVTIEEYADLRVTKSDSTDPLLAGELLTYTIGITNTGPADASNVVVTDTLPSGLTLVSATPSQGACTGVVCALGWISATHTATITLVADVGTALGGVISNTVIVSANEIDPVPGDNTATEQTTILPLADLSLQKTGSPNPVHAGELLTYRLNVTNLGPSAAADVHLVDDLPAEVAFISVQPACGYSAGIVDCTLGILAPGATIPVTITVRVNTSATGTITNLASVSTNTAESDLVNNQAQVVSTLLPPDLVPPVVSWISPVGDEGQLTVGCQVVHLEVNATDNVAVYRVRFYRWDHVINNYVDIGYDYSAPYQWELDTCNLPLGQNQIFAAAQDTSGNPANWSTNRKRILLRRSLLLFLPAVMRNNN